MLISDDFTGEEVLEELMQTIESHDGHLSIKRSDSVMSPQGPTGYKEIIEVHWKSMDSMFDWVSKMEKAIPESRREALTGMQIIFYDYK